MYWKVHEEEPEPHTGLSTPASPDTLPAKRLKRYANE